MRRQGPEAAATLPERDRRGGCGAPGACVGNIRKAVPLAGIAARRRQERSEIAGSSKSTARQGAMRG